MNIQTKTGCMLLFVGMDWHKGLSPEEMQKVSGEWMAWFKRLAEEGKAVAGHPLERDGKTVSGKNGRVVADRLFAEAKEAIGGNDGINDRPAFRRYCAGRWREQHQTLKNYEHDKKQTYIEPYLFFDGRCEEALEFYRKAIGAEVDMLMRFKDSPEPHRPGMVPPGSENKVMHVNFRIGDTSVMASDGRCEGKPHFDGFALSLGVETEAEADRVFAALADGGKVQMPSPKRSFRRASGWWPTALACCGW